MRSGHFAVARGWRYTLKKKSKVVACAERPFRRCERVAVHAKKEKQGCGVCGAATSPLRKGGGTRQKRKSKVVACAERPFRRCERAAVHAKKEKQGCGVCGAAISPLREGGGTR